MRMISVFAAIAVVCAGCVDSGLGGSEALCDAAETWPQFRGPSGDGVVPGSVKLPTEWSSTENIAWRTELPGLGWSSPVVGDGRVYMTTAISRSNDAVDSDADEPVDLAFVVVDVVSGDLIDVHKVFELFQDRPAKRHAKNSHASPTPILDGDRLFLHFGYQGTACVTVEGEIVWVNRELYFNPTHGNGGSPILVQDRLIFTCDGGDQPRIVALDADTGSVAWQTPRPVQGRKTFSFCTPTAIEVDGQVQIIAPGSDSVLALNPANGDVIWQVDYTGYSVVPKPVYHRGLVFVATSFDRSTLLAIRPTGKGNVTETHVVWSHNRKMPKTPSLIAADGLLYALSDDGILTCLEAETGEQVYVERVGGNYSASPLLAAGHLYLTSERGVTTVVKAGRRYREIAKNDLGERTLASPAVWNRSLLIRTADAIYRIGD